MLNRIILIGRLTRDPELRYSPAGVAVTSFTLAVDRNNTNKEVDFIPVVTFKQTAEAVANYLRKGRLTAVEGRIQTRNYENNEGRRIYVTEVVADNVRFLEKSEASSQHSEKNNNEQYSGDGKAIDISDDDLPF
ncbi:single-stranded DNA-binding protein [Paenibacillus sp. FSL R10-2791]|uniref:single-stranded DNA-binding protein n=1 Tax=Paenibacillus sp. FSL R10-2791 TaxID=2954695 RepID=UPI0030F7F387